MKKLTPQADIVLTHLRHHGALTPWKAEGIYRIRRLASRIDELRAGGYEIVSSTHRDATGQRYTRYALSPRQRIHSGPLLVPRSVPKQYRLEHVLNLYHHYCVAWLGLDALSAHAEVEDFREFLTETA